MSDSHELAMFLELYNANPWSRSTGMFIQSNYSNLVLCKHVCIYAVTGDANFSMSKTSLTVGGFNQPSFARALIEMPGNAEKGLSQRFLWIFPKPLYGKFDSLEPIRQDFSDKIGTHTSV